jgi:hypothetical protein
MSGQRENSHQKMKVGYLTMDFNVLLMEVIDEELASLGESCRLAIYIHLKKGFNLDKQEIPFRVKEFAEAIENVFGAGAKILEIRLMENLFKKIGYIHPRFQTQEKLEFVHYVESVKKNMHHLIHERILLPPLTS